MAYAQRRSFLDRPAARVLAAIVFLGAVAALVYLERAQLWQAVADQSAADDPFARCFAERTGEIDQMVAENVIDQAQAELFKSRAEAMCRAAAAEPSGADAPAPPAQ